MRIAFLGLGLIGGSIARALAAQAGSAWSLAAWTPRGDGPRLAAEGRVIGLASPTAEGAMEGADLIVIAAPPLAAVDLLGRLAGSLRSAVPRDAVITDVASTKSAIVSRAAELGLRFVGGHPMAGREADGFGASDAALFRDRPWVVVPSGDRQAEGRVEALAIACGARVVTMTAIDHDRSVAAISHLPLVLSAALVDAVTSRADWPEAAPLAAGGWASMTRLARGEVEMGTGIATTNAREIAERLRDVRGSIDRWLADLDGDAGPDEDAIRARLRAARAALLEEPGA